MNHYRCRDRITTMDVIIIAALAVAVMVALATCGQAADGLTLYEQTELKTYTLPNIGPSQTGMVINFDDSGQGFWYCLDPYDAVKWKAHNPPQWDDELTFVDPQEGPTISSISFDPNYKARWVFPDGSEWVEGEPSPWVNRKEFEAYKEWVKNNCFCPDWHNGVVTPSSQYNPTKGE